jgi:uncharacterized protein (TIGR03084 family)
VTTAPGPALEGVTPFASWRALDVLAHLVTLDRMAVFALRGDPRYDDELAAFGAAVGEGPATETYARMNAFERTRAEVADPARLVTQWRRGVGELCDLIDRTPADRSLGWFGRPMSAARLAAARQMEVFAYGQDIVDLLGATRPSTDRLRPVADFAVRTFSFAFRNRGLEVPALPAVRLLAPSGAVWEWGDPAGPDRVGGPAEDLCLVATQRRNVADTRLVVTGDTATRWLQIAQTIAGPPRDGPAPGARTGDHGAR